MKNESQFFNLMYFSKWVKEPKVQMGSSTVEEKVAFKRLYKLKDKLYRKLQLLFFCGAVRGILYIKLKLKLYQTCRELFILELEQGQEVFIPKELNN